MGTGTDVAIQSAGITLVKGELNIVGNRRDAPADFAFAEVSHSTVGSRELGIL
jgi:hypothetical protein